jgi:hypothetical protein
MEDIATFDSSVEGNGTFDMIFMAFSVWLFLLADCEPDVQPTKVANVRVPHEKGL